MKKQKVNSISKYLGFGLAIVLLIVAVPMFQIVLGFTNPTDNPPEGAGKLARSGSNISVSSSRVVDVSTPIDANDAANKAYVDAAGSSSGGGTITLYGIKGGFPAPTQTLQPGGGVPTCLRWYAGSTSCSNNTAASQTAGLGAGTCATNVHASSTTVFDGYGPFNMIYANSGFTRIDGDPGSPYNPEPTDVGENAESLGGMSGGAMASINDSLCSASAYHIVRVGQNYPGTVQVGSSHTVVPACGTGGSAPCNVCTVCTYDPSWF